MSRLTDAEVCGAVMHALARDGRVNSADVIHVSTEGGRVRLVGTVGSAGEKQAAGEIARRIPGVADVENDLTVSMNGEIADAELRDAVLAALARRPHLMRRVGCTVDDGVVTLVGHIRDAGEEKEAMQIAAGIHGVEQVVSALEIAGVVPDETELPPDDATLMGKLAEALAVAEVDIYRRNLHVDQGVAVLEGFVPSEKERERAEDVAASVDGIRAVQNRLVLRQSEASTDPDEALIARVQHALARDGRVSPGAVQVFASGGVVHVTGQVDSIEDQNAVVDVIRTVPGVRRVDSDVVVMGRSSAPSGDKGEHFQRIPQRRRGRG